jgi:hypothetical protein
MQVHFVPPYLPTNDKVVYLLLAINPQPANHTPCTGHNSEASGLPMPNHVIILMRAPTHRVATLDRLSLQAGTMLGLSLGSTYRLFALNAAGECFLHRPVAASLCEPSRAHTLVCQYTKYSRHILARERVYSIA